MAAQPTYFTLTTTDGRAAVVPVPPGQDRWLIAVRYVRAYYLGEVYLDDVRPATPQEVATFQAEHTDAWFAWLADDP